LGERTVVAVVVVVELVGLGGTMRATLVLGTRSKGTCTNQCL
jgi:hypothetical protein